MNIFFIIFISSIISCHKHIINSRKYKRDIPKANLKNSYKRSGIFIKKNKIKITKDNFNIKNNYFFLSKGPLLKGDIIDIHIERNDLDNKKINLTKKIDKKLQIIIDDFNSLRLNKDIAIFKIPMKVSHIYPNKKIQLNYIRSFQKSGIYSDIDVSAQLNYIDWLYNDKIDSSLLHDIKIILSNSYKKNIIKESDIWDKSYIGIIEDMVLFKSYDRNMKEKLNRFRLIEKNIQRKINLIISLNEQN